jgi:hypothetical protein
VRIQHKQFRDLFFVVVVVIHRRDEEPIYSYRLIADVDSCNKSIPAEIVCLTSEREQQLVKHQEQSAHFDGL